SLSRYSCCKPHSASYALLAFKSCYLKAHHPAEFMAAVISNGGGYYSTFAYVSECRRMGLEVLPPDVNDSDKAYTGRDRRVRVGWMANKGVRGGGGQASVQEREGGGALAPRRGFPRRGPVSRPGVRVLIRARGFGASGG